MPFKSKAQMRYLWATNPKVARRWADKYGVGKDLPERLHEAKRKAMKPKKKRG